MTDPNNSTVIAVLGEKMDNMEGLLQMHIDSCKATVKDHADRIRANEVQLAGLNQRFGWMAGILGSLQVITVSIAAWLGLKG